MRCLETLTKAAFAIPLRKSGRDAVKGNGICVGVTTRGFPPRADLSSDTYRLRDEIKALVAALRALPSFPKDFSFSSIQLNDALCEPHVDKK